MMTEATEVEAKFILRHLADIRKRVLSAGGHLLTPRTLERNLRFDTPEGDLSTTLQVLRLRQDSRITLTYKRSQSTEERTEIELEVDDFHSAKALLQALGFQIVFIYEKYRETFALDPTHVMLDELPFGCFVEVEGPTLEAVALTAATLGLDWESRVRQDYHGLFETLHKHLKLPFRDATFANFADRPAIQPTDLDLNLANQIASASFSEP
jgi:adenylate cyclase class 2